MIVKEAAIPALIGLAVIISLATPYPLVKTLLYSPQVFDLERIQKALQARQTEARFQSMLTIATILLAVSFFFSAVLNYFVAAHFIQTEPAVDPAQFNREVGQMTAWSWLIIAVPSLLITVGALFYLIRGIRLCTGLTLDEAMAAHHREAAESAK